MSLPLVVRTARAGFERIDPRLSRMSQSLGEPRWTSFRRVTLPLARPAIVAAAVLGFARAMGEFGATMMIAGNIPGRTETLASAIYSAQQAGDGDGARALILVALAIGFGAVLAAEILAARMEGGDRR